MLIQMTSMPAYATIHCLFALQYLRAGLTVPLFFERQIRKNSNFDDRLTGYDRKVSQRKCFVVISQAFILVLGFSFTAYFALYWIIQNNLWT